MIELYRAQVLLERKQATLSHWRTASERLIAWKARDSHCLPLTSRESNPHPDRRLSSCGQRATDRPDLGPLDRRLATRP
jgi:hypothetical protein